MEQCLGSDLVHSMEMSLVYMMTCQLDALMVSRMVPSWAAVLGYCSEHLWDNHLACLMAAKIVIMLVYRLGVQLEMNWEMMFAQQMVQNLDELWD